MPFRDAEATIAEQLDALAAQELNATWEVVLVDNRSTDRSRAIADAWAAQLTGARVVAANDSDGVAYARNVGLRAAAAPLVAFCDADDIVQPRWLQALVDALAVDDLVGGLVDELALNPPEVLAWKAPRRRDGLQVVERFLPYAPGSNFGVHRAAAEAVGGWDERYPFGGNDVEFSWRVQLAGYRLGWAPNAVVHYRHRSTMRPFLRQSFWRGFASVQLVRGFRRHGVGGRHVRETCRSVAILVRYLPALVRGTPKRGRWLGVIAHEAGRLAARWPLCLLTSARRRPGGCG